MSMAHILSLLGSTVLDLNFLIDKVGLIIIVITLYGGCANDNIWSTNNAQ